MPLITQDQAEQNLGIREQETASIAPIEGEATEKPSFTEAFGAGFRRENTIYNAFGGMRDRAYQNILGSIPEENFDVFEELARPENEQFIQFAESAVYIKDSLTFHSWQERMTKQVNDQQILADGGFGGMLGAMSGGVLDPTMFVPGMIYLKGAKTLKTITTGLASGSALGVGVIGAQEAILHGAQPTRTVGETAIALTAGALIGGAIGGAAAASLGIVSRKQLTALATDALNNKASSDFGPSSVGAAQRDLIKEEGLIGVNDTLAKILTGNGMTVQGQTSKSGLVRQFANRLYERGTRTGKQEAGQVEDIATESLMAVDQARLVTVNKELRQIKTGYLKANRRSEGHLSSDEFNKEVAKAQSKGDIHDISEVAATAKLMRTSIDKNFNRLQELNLAKKSATTKEEFDVAQKSIADKEAQLKSLKQTPDDSPSVKKQIEKLETDIKHLRNLDPPSFTANESWFMQTWNRDEIVARRDEFVNYLTNKFEDPLRKSDQFRKFSPEDLDDLKVIEDAERSVDNILGVGDSALNSDAFIRHSLNPKSVKPRKIDVPQEEALDSGWILADAEHSFNSFMHTSNTSIRIKEMFDGLGVDNMVQYKKMIRDELTQKGLNNKIAGAERYIDDSIALMSNSFDFLSPGETVETALRTLRKYNVSTMLGGVVISSVADAAGHVLVNGMGRTIRDSMLPMVRNIKASNLAKEQLQDILMASRALNNDVLRRITETGVATGRTRGTLERFGDATIDIFSTATGMPYWNSSHRVMAGLTSQARTIRTLNGKFKAGTISKADKQRLVDLGLDDDLQKRIFAQHTKYGEEIDGSFLLNMHRWSDVDAADKLAAGINKEVNNVVLIPGKGDLPSTAQTEIGKTILQFKSFVFTASNRLLLRGVQRHDAQTFMHLFAAVGLGALTYAIKRKLEGKDIDDDPLRLVSEGISRSGVSGMMGDINFGLNPWSGSTRYAGLKFTGYAFGPSAAVAANAYGAAASMAQDGKVSDASLGKLRRLVPFNNLFYLRAAVTAYKD